MASRAFSAKFTSASSSSPGSTFTNQQSAATAVASLTDDPIELLSLTSKPPVMARAASAELAHAIFRAVRSEHPERRIILREGDRIVADSRAE